MIDVTIKTLDSQNHEFSVPDTFTILELKEFISVQVNVQVDQQRLIFWGQVLSNETYLADIGIDGKVMHLVQKVPRLPTTTSGSSSSTTTNTTSRSRQDAARGFRGFTEDPTSYYRAIGIPPEILQAIETPSGTREPGTYNRMLLALEMIRRGNEILNRLEHPPQSSASNAEQYPEGSQHSEASSISVQPERVQLALDMIRRGNEILNILEHPQSSDSNAEQYSVASSTTLSPESVIDSEMSDWSESVPQSPTDPDSLDVIHFDEMFPNVVATFDDPHHMSMLPEEMAQGYNHMEANNLFLIHQNATETSAEDEFSNVPVGGSTNQSSAEPSSISLPFSAPFEHNLRNDQTSDNRSTGAILSRLHLRELIEELNKLNERFRPFYAMYCQSIINDPRFATTEGEYGSLSRQSIFNGVSEVMHFISHVYHTISDMRVAFIKAPPSSFQTRPGLQPVTTTAAPPSTQHPTSTQTTFTSQSMPSVRDFRLDYGGGSETPRTTDSSSTTNLPSQGLDCEPFVSSPHMDPFLPCSSYHFERNVRSVVLERRSTQGTDRSTSSAYSGNSTAQATGQSSSFTDTSAEQIMQMERSFGLLDRSVDSNTNLEDPILQIGDISIPDFMQSTPFPPNTLLTITIGEIPYFRSLDGQSMLVDFFLIISRNWTLRDMLSVNLMSETSTLRTNPVTSHSEELINFILDRIMLNRPPSNQNIEDAANRIFLEISQYIKILKHITEIVTNINVTDSFRRCILHHLREIINYCGEDRTGAIDNIVHLLTMFGKGFLSLVAHCCNSLPLFRVFVFAVLEYIPFPSNLRSFIMNEYFENVDQYWERIRTFQMMGLSLVDYIIPFIESAQPLRESNDGQRSNSSMPSSENINEQSSKVIIGSQDLHHNVPSVLIPAIDGPSKSQKSQATQEPHDDAHSSGVPNKRRMIVTSSKQCSESSLKK